MLLTRFLSWISSWLIICIRGIARRKLISSWRIFIRRERRRRFCWLGSRTKRRFCRRKRRMGRWWELRMMRGDFEHWESDSKPEEGKRSISQSKNWSSFEHLMARQDFTKTLMEQNQKFFLRNPNPQAQSAWSHAQSYSATKQPYQRNSTTSQTTATTNQQQRNSTICSGKAFQVGITPSSLPKSTSTMRENLKTIQFLQS